MIPKAMIHFTAVAALFAASTGCESDSPNTAVDSLRIYSPAAPPSPMVEHNQNLAAALNRCKIGPVAEIVPRALPDAINVLANVGEDDRANDWQIVTSVDYLPATTGTGPDWHSYDRANTDLLFISALYDVGFGLLAFSPEIRVPEDLRGKRIAVPKRPSSLRVLVEAQLRDGWGILDDVELIDLPPPVVALAVKVGKVDATFWNMMLESPDGFAPMIPSLSKTGHWIGVDDRALAAINAANDFSVDTVAIDGDAGAQLLSLRQGLAAWASSDTKTIDRVLNCITANVGAGPGLPATRAEMQRWPGLTEGLMHPSARALYATGSDSEE